MVPLKYYVSRINQKAVLIVGFDSSHDILRSELEKNLTLLGFNSVTRGETIEGSNDNVRIIFEENGLKHMECLVEVSSQNISIVSFPTGEKKETIEFKAVCSQRHMYSSRFILGTLPKIRLYFSLCLPTLHCSICFALSLNCPLNKYKRFIYLFHF